MTSLKTLLLAMLLPCAAMAQEDPAPPRVVVLIHGILFPLSGDVGQPRFARGYWSREFVQGLLGGTETPTLITLEGTPLADDAAWFLDRVNTGDLGERFVADGRKLRQGSAPPLACMLTSHNGTRGFLEQCRDTIAEIDLLLSWYQRRFGVEPEILVLGHSMGGLIGRLLLTNPDPELFEDPLLNPDGIVFPERSRAAMDRLRNRTRLLITLGSPHEGTRIADNGEQIVDRLRGGLDALGERQEDVVGGGVRGLLETFGGAIEGVNSRPVDSKQSARMVTDAVERLIDDLRSAQSRDLTRQYWRRMNREALHPERMVRPEGSPLNQGEDRCIPVHTFGGRTPGGAPFSTLSPLRNLKSLADQDHLSLMLAEVFSDMCQKSIAGGWGRPDPMAYGVYAAELDQVERITLAGLIEAGIGVELDERLKDAFGPDIGGVLARQIGWLEISFPVYLRHRWTLDMGGRITIPVPYLVCTAVDTEKLSEEARERMRVALDQADLAAALRKAYASFRDRVDGIEGLTLEELLQALEAGGALTKESALAAGELVKRGTEAAVALAREFGPDAVGCIDPRAWTIRHFDVAVPSPRPVETDVLASDGEIDADGPVPYDSAMGLHLGTLTPGAFDHTLPGGSWHRHFQSIFEGEGHISQTKGRPLGAYLHQYFLRSS
ncbi:MAG: hypothetical protein V2A76_09440 [Planctomycetota bacterium]